jgi:glycosyltransferase involved in cell wall biosynthesis
VKVDVAMCTWNSNKPWFKSCLAAIKREIPFCHFIVVDRFSVDGTVEVVKRFFLKL